MMVLAKEGGGAGRKFMGGGGSLYVDTKFLRMPLFYISHFGVGIRSISVKCWICFNEQ